MQQAVEVALLHGMRGVGYTDTRLSLHYEKLHTSWFRRRQALTYRLP